MKKHYRLAGVLVAVLLVLIMIPVSAVNADRSSSTTKLYVTGTYHQTDARSMLTLVNGFRTNQGTEQGDQAWWWDPDGGSGKIAVTGLAPLAYDYGLEEIAMQRAAELAVQYSHTRPDGTTVIDVDAVNGENIACGENMTMEEAFTGWLEADKTTFDDQGHRVNMLGGYFVDSDTGEVYQNFLTTIGIAHFEYNGVDYWVQEFAAEPVSETPAAANDAEATAEVNTLSSLISAYGIAMSGDITLEIGGTYDLVNAPVVTMASVTNTADWIGTNDFPTDSTYTWEKLGDLENQITTLEGTVLTGVSAGTVNLAVTNSYGKVLNTTAQVTPIDIANAVVTAEKTEFKVGETIWYFRSEKLKVTLNGKELVLGQDYCADIYHNGSLSYRDWGSTGMGTTFVSVGTLKYVIKGKGNYTGTALQELVDNIVQNTGMELASESGTGITLGYGGGTEDIRISGNYTYMPTDLEIVSGNESIVKATRLGDDWSTDRTTIRLEPVDTGTTTVTVRLKDNEERYTASNTLTFSVTVEPCDLSNAELSGINQVYQYTGQEIKPEPIVKVNGTPLIKDTDYTLSYIIDGVSVNSPVGSHSRQTDVTITATGTGDKYTGSASIVYSIKPIVFDVEFDSSYEYDPTGVKPVPIVKCNGNTLVLDEDYELSYGANDTVGEGAGTVIVTGLGDYFAAGSVAYTFNITPVDITNAVVTAEKTEFMVGETIWYFRSEKLKVTLNGKELVLGQDYCADIYHNGSLSYRDWGSTGMGTTFVSVGTTKYVIKGKGSYTGTASQELEDTIVPNTEMELASESGTGITLGYGGGTEDIHISGNYTYMPTDLEIVSGNESIVKATRLGDDWSTDRTTIRLEPIGAGTTNVTVRLKETENRYAASNTLTFAVTVSKISFMEHVTAVLVDPDAEYVFNPASSHMPAVNVYYDQTTKLEENKDYVVRYEDNVYAGTGKVIVSPVDTEHYDGEVTVPFTIKPYETELTLSSVSENMEFGDERIVNFSGAVSSNEPVLTVSNDVVDARIESFNYRTGKGEIHIKGKGIGSATISFVQEADNRFTGTEGEIAVTVTAATIPEDEIEIIFPDASVIFDGTPKMPELTVKARGVTLTKDQYDVTFDNNITAGKASVTVTGKNGLTFTKTAGFDIELPDATAVRMAITLAKGVLSTVKISEDGKVTVAGEEVMITDLWVTQEVYTKLTEAIGAAEALIEQGGYTMDDLETIKGILETAYNEFIDSIKPGTVIPPMPEPPAPAPGTDPTQMGEGGSAIGKGASAAAAEKAITNSTSDEGPAGSKFAPLMLKASKTAKTSLTVTWKKPAGAKSFVIYGNKCGKGSKMVKLGTSTGSKFTLKKIAGKKLAKGTYYKLMVVALDAKMNVVTTSKTVHAGTAGGKAGNPAKITTKAKKNKVTVKVKKTFKLAAKQTGKKIKKHRVIKYESSNEAVAAVSAKGVIKGKAKGTCFVYAYAQNGVCAKIKVTVK